MSEATEINNSNTNATQHVTQQAPVETERTIPYSRFQEVNEAKKALETRLAEIEANQKAETEKRLAEQNEYRKLYDSRAADLAKAQQDAAKVPAYEETLGKVLAAQVAELPEEKRGLIPDALTTQQKLDWLAKNAAILKAPAAFDIGAGRQGGGSGSTVKITPEQHEIAVRFGMSDLEYLKNL